MKKSFAFHFCQILKQFFFSVRKLNYILSAYLIIVFLLSLTSPVFSQSESIKKALDNYKKNFYLWKEPETRNSNSDSVLTVLGRWAWGPCNAVDAKGNYAYIGNGPSFQTLDIFEPTSPHITGEYLTEGYIYDIEVRNNSAFVCIGSGLLILDVSNPLSPQEISFIEIGGVAITFALDSSFVYVTTFSGFMRVVDISDISNPFLRGIIPTLAEFPNCIEAKDGYIYIGSPEVPYMQIVNATNPDSLTESLFDSGGRGISSFIKDTLLFVGSSWYSTFLKVYDISDLSNPELVGQVEIDDSTLIDGIAVAENGLTAYAICLTSSSTTFAKGVYAIDISDLTSPVIIDNFERASQVSAPGIVLVQNTLLAAYFSGVCILNITNPNNMQFDSFFPTGGFSNKIQVKDSLAYVASGLAGLWILNVSNPELPKAIANVNTGGFTSDLVVEDTVIYFVNWAAYEQEDTTRGLWIVNISNIYAPKIISHYVGIINFSSHIIPNSITKSANLIIITQAPTTFSNDIMELIDISNLYQPLREGVFTTNIDPYDVVINDTIAYLATNENLKIINISDSANPNVLSSILNSARGVTFQNSLVYTSTSEFSIINVNDLLNPFIVSTINTQSNSYGRRDLVVFGNYAYWAELYLGIIDVSDPNYPILVTRFLGKDVGNGVAVQGDRIYFADQAMGVWILRNNLITDIRENGNPTVIKDYKLYQNYPNPFNSTTTIEFEIPERQKVIIEVFDVLGKKIRTLLNKEEEKGKNNVKFDSANLSSGIYFFRLTASNKSIALKMVILK